MLLGLTDFKVFLFNGTIANAEPKLLFVVNDLSYFASHRIEVAKLASSLGYQIHVVYGGKSLSTSVDGLDACVRLHHITQKRGQFSPLRDFYFAVKIWFLLTHLRPEIVHTISLKSVVLCGFALLFVSNVRVVASINGFGSWFAKRKESSNGVRRHFILWLLSLVLSRSSQWVIVQNRHDKEIIRNLTVVDDHKLILVPGAGVNLKTYRRVAECGDVVRIVMASRLLWEKGVREFVEAASVFKRHGREVEFVLAGEPDPEKASSVPSVEIEGWVEQGLISYVGFCDDVNKLFADSHIVVLPSFYGEGLPKILIEAAACGRPVVTTDVPGCKDAVIHGHTGLLVPALDVDALCEALNYLSSNPAIRAQMGIKAREFAEKKFDIASVLDAHRVIYEFKGH